MAPSTKRIAAISEEVATPSSAYSQAIIAGDLVITSGYLGTTPNGRGLVGGGFEAEVRQALDNITAVLSAAGTSWSDVVRVNVSLTDVSRFSEMDEIYRGYAIPPYPARNTIGVAALWGGAQFGVDVIAVRTES